MSMHRMGVVKYGQTDRISNTMNVQENLPSRASRQKEKERYCILSIVS